MRLQWRCGAAAKCCNGAAAVGSAAVCTVVLLPPLRAPGGGCGWWRRVASQLRKRERGNDQQKGCRHLKAAGRQAALHRRRAYFSLATRDPDTGWVGGATARGGGGGRSVGSRDSAGGIESESRRQYHRPCNRGEAQQLLDSIVAQIWRKWLYCSPSTSCVAARSVCFTLAQGFTAPAGAPTPSGRATAAAFAPRLTRRPSWQRASPAPAPSPASPGRRWRAAYRSEACRPSAAQAGKRGVSEWVAKACVSRCSRRTAGMQGTLPRREHSTLAEADSGEETATSARLANSAERRELLLLLLLAAAGTALQRTSCSGGRGVRRNGSCERGREPPLRHAWREAGASEGHVRADMAKDACAGGGLARDAVRERG